MMLKIQLLNKLQFNTVYITVFLIVHNIRFWCFGEHKGLFSVTYTILLTSNFEYTPHKYLTKN